MEMGVAVDCLRSFSQNGVFHSEKAPSCLPQINPDREVEFLLGASLAHVHETVQPFPLEPDMLLKETLRFLTSLK